MMILNFYTDSLVKIAAQKTFFVAFLFSDQSDAAFVADEIDQFVHFQVFDRCVVRLADHCLRVD
jgi:hypothetical protein